MKLEKLKFSELLEERAKAKSLMWKCAQEHYWTIRKDHEKRLNMIDDEADRRLPNE